VGLQLGRTWQSSIKDEVARFAVHQMMALEAPKMSDTRGITVGTNLEDLPFSVRDC
jgi:hypothetical protein